MSRACVTRRRASSTTPKRPGDVSTGALGPKKGHLAVDKHSMGKLLTKSVLIVTHCIKRVHPKPREASTRQTKKPSRFGLGCAALHSANLKETANEANSTFPIPITCSAPSLW